MASKAPRSKRPSTLGKLSDAEIEARWRSLRPKALKGMAVSGLVLLVCYLVLHFNYPVHPNQHPAFLSMEYIVSLLFQISCVFTACGAFLSLMCWMYGQGSRKGNSTRA